MLKTEIIEVNENSEDIFGRVVKQFQIEPVAFPTETVYGLGAIVWREDLIKKVFEIKNRPNDNPLIVHVSNMEMLLECIEGEVPQVYMELIDLYWPGPLTLIFRKSKRIPYSVTGGGEYVAIRIPNHRTTLQVIDRLKAPIVGPSANKSTRPSPTKAEHVLEDLNGELSMIIDGGACEKGVESTVINGLHSPPLFLRPGAITYEEIKEYLPELTFISKGVGEKVSLCPGMRYKHYSPSSPLTMVTGTVSEQIKKISELIDGYRKKSEGNETLKKIGFLLPESHISQLDLSDFTLFSLGATYEEMSFRLFDGLRYLDRYTENIYSVSLEDTLGGRVLMDRLRRATTYSV